MTSVDPVYLSLKVIEQQLTPEFQQIGVEQRDFNTVLRHIHEAGYARAGKLTQAGRDYIRDYEKRLQ
ncbi:hypothetical protein [Paenibacillus sp. HW567]|uniref:hypothetical protein n=1 Tax=Paenibacillus sp. HW567 TaxID=1034769 RepID=UPI0003791A94|nr:hypothetical protein [Paenibacillus sp. HW567]